MLLKCILLALIAGIGSVDEQLFGATMMGRPLVLGTFVGLVLGDLKTGLILGASLEAMFMGSIMIGNAVPPEVCTSSVLAVSIGILTGRSEAAIALAIPISMVFQLWKNVVFAFVGAYSGKKADECAEKLDVHGIAFWHLVPVPAAIAIPAMALIFFGTYFGVEPITTVVNAIPDMISNGLTVATGVLPAVGLGLLINLMVNKKNIAFLFLGFIAAACLGMTVIEIAAIGLLIALLISNNEQTQLMDEEDL